MKHHSKCRRGGREGLQLGGGIGQPSAGFAVDGQSSSSLVSRGRLSPLYVTGTSLTDGLGRTEDVDIRTYTTGGPAKKKDKVPTTARRLSSFSKHNSVSMSFPPPWIVCWSIVSLFMLIEYQ